MRTRNTRRGLLLSTDDPTELTAPRLPAGEDVGWAVSELYEAAWIAAGNDPEAFSRSPRRSSKVGPARAKPS